MPRVSVRKGVLTPYKSYIFKGGQDPVVQKVLHVMEDSGKTIPELHERSGVSTAAMYNWRRGITSRPQYCTVAAVYGACGMRLVAVEK